MVAMVMKIAKYSKQMGSCENLTSMQTNLMKLGLLLDDNMHIMHIALNMFSAQNCG